MKKVSIFIEDYKKKHNLNNVQDSLLVV